MPLQFGLAWFEALPELELGRLSFRVEDILGELCVLRMYKSDSVFKQQHDPEYVRIPRVRDARLS